MTTTQSKSSTIKGILGVKLGMTQVFDENNKVIPVTVVEANEEQVILDANHPLAGKDLNFAIELVEIKAA